VLLALVSGFSCKNANAQYCVLRNIASEIRQNPNAEHDRIVPVVRGAAQKPVCSAAGVD
jgi:hypothetical protein